MTVFVLFCTQSPAIQTDLTGAISACIMRKMTHNDPDARPNFQPLARYLGDLSIQRVTLSFDQLEQILGCALPPAACMDRFWWANDDKQEHTWAWYGIGWQVEAVYVRARVVTFTR